MIKRAIYRIMALRDCVQGISVRFRSCTATVNPLKVYREFLNPAFVNFSEASQKTCNLEVSRKKEKIMLNEREIYFARQQILNPQHQKVEEVASESHETRRIPDAYIYVLKNSRLETPNGSRVEDYIDKSTHLGKVEADGFNKIQDWAAKSDGYSVWFSPTYPGRYPVTKIIIQETGRLEDGSRFVLNRAIVLDTDDDYLLLSASILSGCSFTDTESLRATPIFPDKYRFINWYEYLSKHINQLKLVNVGEDLKLKQKTYSKLGSIFEFAKSENKDDIYSNLHNGAENENLIGTYTGSCPPQINTAFMTIFESSHILNTHEGKKLNCTCPFCNKKVIAKISAGKIYCPHLNCEGNKGVAYKC